MLKNIFYIKILNLYIFKIFAIRFFIILLFAIISALLIETASTLGKVKMFDFFLNLENIFSFIFFISSMWAILKLQKTREFIITQTSTVSIFKVLKIFLIFALLWSIFFIYIYEGFILQNLAQRKLNEKTLERFEIYNKNDNDCNYEVLIFNTIKLLPNDTFTFKTADIIDFKSCNFKNHFPLLTGTVDENVDNIVIKSTNFNLETDYSFNVFKSYFEEKIDKEKYRSLFSNIILIKKFSKFEIEYREIEISLMRTIQNIASFFYAIAISFLFFIKLPPRGKVTIRIFTSICFVACIYIMNIIVSSYVEKSLILSPTLIIVPSIMLFFSIILILIFKKT